MGSVVVHRNTDSSLSLFDHIEEFVVPVFRHCIRVAVDFRRPTPDLASRRTAKRCLQYIGPSQICWSLLHRVHRYGWWIMIEWFQDGIGYHCMTPWRLSSSCGNSSPYKSETFLFFIWNSTEKGLELSLQSAFLMNEYLLNSQRQSIVTGLS